MCENPRKGGREGPASAQPREKGNAWPGTGRRRSDLPRKRGEAAATLKRGYRRKKKRHKEVPFRMVKGGEEFEKTREGRKFRSPLREGKRVHSRELSLYRVVQKDLWKELRHM